jgi:hypothetical protein
MTAVHEQNGHVFTTHRRLGWAAAGSLGLGGLLLLFLVASFIILVNTPPRASNASMIASFGSVAVLPLLSIWYGVRLLRAPMRVTTDEHGLTVESHVSRRRFEWAQIASLVRDRASGPGVLSPFAAHHRAVLEVLILRDEAGRELVRLTNHIAGLTVLAEEVEARSSAARGRATFDPSAQGAEHLRRLRRTARRGALLGGLLAAASLTIALLLLVDSRAEAHLRRTGVLTSAKIEIRYMHKGAPRVEYSFRDDGGVAHERDVLVEQGAWDALAGVDYVEVRYLRGNPERSHLASGEIVDEPPLLVLLSGAAFMALLGLIVLVLPILGIVDVAWKDGRLQLVRASTSVSGGHA